MRVTKLTIAVSVVFLVMSCGNVWCMSPQQSLMEQLKLISANRNSSEFLSLVTRLLGIPDKTFRYSNYDVWFYSKLSVSFVDKPLKNVYLFIRNGEIVSIKTFKQSLNPYTDFESYP